MSGFMKKMNLYALPEIGMFNYFTVCKGICVDRTEVTVVV